MYRRRAQLTESTKSSYWANSKIWLEHTGTINWTYLSLWDSDRLLAQWSSVSLSSCRVVLNSSWRLSFHWHQPSVLGEHTLAASNMTCIPLNIQSASCTRKFTSKFESDGSNLQKKNSFYDLDDFGVRINFSGPLHIHACEWTNVSVRVHADWAIVVLLLEIPPMLSHDSQGTGRWCRGWVHLLATRRSRSQKAAFLVAKNGGTIPTAAWRNVSIIQ